MKSESATGETKRIALIHSLEILDTGREPMYEDITSMASAMTETPMALISFVDRTRVWFKSTIGFPASEVRRGGWFCESTVLGSEILTVPDASLDDRFRQLQHVLSEPGIRFYAGVPIILNDGPAIGAVCVLDTTPRTLTDKQRELLSALGKHVSALLQSRRDQRAMAKELSVNKELAGSASKVRSSFLANMSHEIRTPMTAILGMADLLLSSELKKDQREHLEIIRSSGETLLNTINDILDFSKLESGKMELERQSVDLRACVEETLDALSQRSHARRNELVYVVDAGVPRTILGDGGRIRQILFNLVGNAIKFTRNGEILISVRAQKRTESGVELDFSVKDTGIGIPKDKLDVIFDAFTQVDSSVTRKYGGSGLGLVICSRLVSMMGGRIAVESKEGEGSRFSFTILASALPDDAPSHVRERSGELNGKSILIVDDSATNLEILSAECEQWGMVPVRASSPSAALEVIRSDRTIEVAIYDMQMPEQDGVQLALETQKLRRSNSFPIVLLSSWDLNDPRIRENRSLFAATVMKPLKMSQFQLLLKGVIGAKNPVPDDGRKDSGTEPKLSSEVPLSIMVAEDNLINQKLIQRMLRSMGYEPVIVGTGLEAVNSLGQQYCDLIFMDVQMPEMDGLEATQMIRQKYGQTAGPSIVAMTAFALSGDKEKCLNAGMNDYVSKPFVADQVASMIRKWGRRSVPTVDQTVSPVAKKVDQVDADIQARLLQLEQETERSFVNELIGIFLEEAPVNFLKLKDAWRVGAKEAIEQWAHKLKGSCLNLGAVKLARYFERVEDLSRKDVGRLSEKDLTEIEREFDRTVTILRSYSAAF